MSDIGGRDSTADDAPVLASMDPETMAQVIDTLRRERARLLALAEEHAAKADSLTLAINAIVEARRILSDDSAFLYRVVEPEDATTTISMTPGEAVTWPPTDDGAVPPGLSEEPRRQADKAKERVRNRVTPPVDEAAPPSPNPKRRVTPPEVRAAAVARIRGGAKIGEVAADLGISWGAVQNWLKAADAADGTTPPPEPEWRQTRQARYTPEQKADAVRMVGNGMRINEVARKMGVAWDTIKGWVETANPGSMAEEMTTPVPDAPEAPPVAPSAPVAARTAPTTREKRERRVVTNTEKAAAVRMAAESGDIVAAKYHDCTADDVAKWRREGFGKGGMNSKGEPIDDDPKAEGPRARCPHCRTMVAVTPEHVSARFDNKTTTPASRAVADHIRTDCKKAPPPRRTLS